MVGLEWLIMGFALGMLGMVLLNMIFLCRITAKFPSTTPKVSILIPARNEELNLQKNLPLWLEQNYQNLEVLVLNDQSDDNTQKVITNFSPKILSLEGKPLPQGWVGKNWACHQLSQKASGEILLFADADVSPAKNAVSETVATMQHYHLDSLSFFLKQTFSHWTSKAVLPWALQFPVLAWAPLFLNRFFNFSTLIIGNGQWFAFTKDTYSKIGGHEAVKNSIVEDISLAKLVHQQRGYHKLFISPNTGSVEMYLNWANLREGLTKNLCLIYGGNLFGNLFFLTLYLTVIGSFFLNGLFSTLVVFSTFFCVQIFFGERKPNPVLALVGLIGWGYLMVSSILARTQKKITWKGRDLNPNSSW